MSTTITDERIAELRRYYGEQQTTSPWLTMEQEMIDRFGDVTRDLDWLHVDPERSKRESPFGTTIAHGFFTLSLLSWFVRNTGENVYPPGAIYALNYGFDRIRMIAPVRAGSRIRNNSTLLGIEPKDADRYIVKTENRVEVEGGEKPALIAEWLVMIVYPPAAA